MSAANTDWFRVSADPVQCVAARDREGATLGSCLVSPMGGGCQFVFCLQVRAEFRRRGIASALMRFIVTTFGRDGLYLQAAPYLDAPVSADDLFAFYERYGFRRRGGNLMYRAPSGEGGK